MKKLNLIILMMSIFSLVFLNNIFAQRGMGRGAGWGPMSTYGRLYNIKTVETIQGEILKIEKFTPIKGMSEGYHLLVKAGQETIPVHLGPVLFVEKEVKNFMPGDKIIITGSRVTFEKKPAIIAMEVKKGEKIITFRDKTGVPKWRGRRRSNF